MCVVWYTGRLDHAVGKIDVCPMCAFLRHVLFSITSQRDSITMNSYSKRSMSACSYHTAASTNKKLESWSRLDFLLENGCVAEYSKLSAIIRVFTIKNKTNKITVLPLKRVNCRPIMIALCLRRRNPKTDFGTLRALSDRGAGGGGTASKTKQKRKTAYEQQRQPSNGGGGRVNRSAATAIPRQ